MSREDVWKWCQCQWYQYFHWFLLNSGAGGGGQVLHVNFLIGKNSIRIFRDYRDWITGFSEIGIFLVEAGQFGRSLGFGVMVMGEDQVWWLV